MCVGVPPDPESALFHGRRRFVTGAVQRRRRALHQKLGPSSTIEMVRACHRVPDALLPRVLYPGLTTRRWSRSASQCAVRGMSSCATTAAVSTSTSPMISFTCVPTLGRQW
jgi:hypothetical protein